MKSKKGAFSALKLLIGMVIFALFVLILGGFYVAMMETYGVPVSSRYADNYNTMNKMTNISTALGNQLQGGELTTLDAFVLAPQSVYSVGQIILNSVTLPYNIISQFQADKEIPIHPAFLTALITILTLVVVWSVFGLFSRWFT